MFYRRLSRRLAGFIRCKVCQRELRKSSEDANITWVLFAQPAQQPGSHAPSIQRSEEI